MRLVRCSISFSLSLLCPISFFEVFLVLCLYIFLLSALVGLFFGIHFFRQRIRCLLSFLFQECAPRFNTHFLNTSRFFSILSQTSRNFLLALDIAFMTILEVFERSGKSILTAPWEVKCVLARLLIS